MSDYPVSATAEEYKRPTNKLTAEHKSALDKASKDMNYDQMSHAANHINNAADKLQNHARKEVTMADYKKAMKGNQEESEPAVE